MMSWFALTLLSAVFLGLYDIAKKAAVHDNAVPMVLLLNVCTAAAIWSPFVVGAWWIGAPQGSWLHDLISLTGTQHLLLMMKSVIVGSSWSLAFFALKHLPISIASPIRATSPLWTISVAVTFLGERPSGTQWLGVVVVLAGFFALSSVSGREGVRFSRNGWVAVMLLATWLGACSALYDKYLLQTLRLPAWTVQAWFSIYLVPVMMPLAVRWWARERQLKPFRWRGSVALIAVFLLIADFAYFLAVAHPDALISVISPVRRSAVVIAFVYGILSLREQNWRPKLACILTILAGVVLISR